MRLSDLYQTDEAFEARHEQRCGHCGALISRWDGTRYEARLVRIRPDCGHSHYMPGGPKLPPPYCPEHCPDSQAS
jgi:hypothetical protein